MSISVAQRLDPAAVLQQYLDALQRKQERDFAALEAARKETRKPGPDGGADQATRQGLQVPRDNPSNFTTANVDLPKEVPVAMANPTRLANLRPVSVEPGPNHFQLSLEGPDPDFAVGGTHEQQEHQRDVTAELTAAASASYASRSLPSFMRYPSDHTVSATIAAPC